MYSRLKQEKATFTHGNVVHLFTVSEFDRWSIQLKMFLALDDCLFGTAKLTKNADPNKYGYSD